MKEKDFKVGDVCLYDKENGKIIVVESSVDVLKNFPKENYTPVGVVVIPSSHDVYGTGECGVMSLKEMSCDTPDEGTISDTIWMYWGGYGNSISTLRKYNSAAVTGTTINPGNGSVTGKVAHPLLPSDNFNNKQCPNDENSHYFYNSSTNNVAPSPYLTDGSRNPNYYMTDWPSSLSNALSDFKGSENTETICGCATSQADWKTDSTITNSGDKGYYPAACCCWRYHTVGTKQGQWYLPAMGELGYVMARLKTINAAITNLISVYGSSVGVQFGESDYYWTSSECPDMYVRCLYTHLGRVTYDFKHHHNSVRAFMRL